MPRLHSEEARKRELSRARGHGVWSGAAGGVRTTSVLMHMHIPQTHPTGEVHAATAVTLPYMGGYCGARHEPGPGTAGTRIDAGRGNDPCQARQ